MGPILGKTHLPCHLFNFPTIERPPPYHQEMLTSPCKGQAHVPYYHFFLGTFVHQDVSTFLLPVKTPFVLHCADLHRSTLAHRLRWDPPISLRLKTSVGWDPVLGVPEWRYIQCKIPNEFAEAHCPERAKQIWGLGVACVTAQLQGRNQLINLIAAN